MKDPYFGALEYSEDLDWYSGEICLFEVNIPISINAENGKADFRKAERIIETFKKERHKAKDTIKDELYDIYREEWAGILFKASRKKFKNKLEPEAVVIYVTDNLDLYFRDGGLFSNHSVVVRFSLDKGFYNVRLSG